MSENAKIKYENITPAPRMELNGHAEEVSIPVFPESIRIYLDTYSPGDLSFTGRHWHRSVQFNVILEGELDLSINGTDIRLGEGEGIFINSNVFHCLNPRGKSACRCYSFQIPPSALCSEKDVELYGKYIIPIISCMYLSCIILKRGEGWQDKILRELDQAFESANGQEYAHELKVKNYLLSAWIILLQNFTAVQTDHADAATSASAERMKEMMSYVGKNHRKKVTLGEIADAAGVSQSECSRCFKKFLNTTPIEYVNQVRISEACSLLRTDVKLSLVSDKLGFTDYSYFHRVFKKYMKCTPKEYQEAMRTDAG